MSKLSNHTEKWGIQMMLGLVILLGFGLIIGVSGIRILRPTERGLIEFLGKYNRFATPGLNWIFPIVENLYRVNITEMLVEAEQQEIITNDNLNAIVDAQIYYKVRATEDDVKNAIYNANNYANQIINLTRTTLRNIIGTMTLKAANSERNKINAELLRTLATETNNWGLDIVRAELKEINPPKDVQETMNKVVKAENEKIAAIDFATATETAADGQKRAEIKRAEGIKQARILEAEGEAQAIKTVNEAAEKYFVGNAQILRKLESVEKSLQNNAKIVIPNGSQLINIISEMAGVLPVKID